jgi:hypothetical protein
LSSSKLIVDDSEDSLIAKELLAQRKENMYNTMQVNLKPIVVAQQATVLEVPVY